MAEDQGLEKLEDELNEWLGNEEREQAGAKSFFGKLRSMVFSRKALFFWVSAILVPGAGFMLTLGERAADDERSTTQTLSQLIPLLGQNNEVGVFAYAVLGSLEINCTQNFFRGFVDERCEASVDHVKDAAQKLATLDKHSSDTGTIAEEKSNAYADVQGASSQRSDAVATAAIANAPSAPAGVTPSVQPNIVYIQIYGTNEQQDAENVRNSLVNLKITTPGIENIKAVDSVAQFQAIQPYVQKNTIDVRYFFENDASAAEWVKHLIGDTLPKSNVSTRNLSGKGFGAQPGSIEIWFPCSHADGCR